MNGELSSETGSDLAASECNPEGCGLVFGSSPYEAETTLWVGVFDDSAMELVFGSFRMCRQSSTLRVPAELASGNESTVSLRVPAAPNVFRCLKLFSKRLTRRRGSPVPCLAVLKRRHLRPSLSVMKEARYIDIANSVFIVLLALALRLLLLDLRPPHSDEGVNGMCVELITKQGFYAYDPTNLHGPLHFYVLWVSEFLLGRNLWGLRLPVAVVSCLSVWMCLRFDRFFPRSWCLGAALALAISPGMVYYGRYAIHESWMVLFSLGLFWGLFGLYRYGARKYLWAAFISASGLFLTKEICLMHGLCLLLGYWVMTGLSKARLVPRLAWAQQQYTTAEVALATTLCLTATAAVYSGFFQNPAGLSAFSQYFAPWVSVAASGAIQGFDHSQPWWYWLALFARYEFLILAGTIAGGAFLVHALWRDRSVREGAKPHPRPSRDKSRGSGTPISGSDQRILALLLLYLGIYGAGTFVAYSLIRYKTPWCFISILPPFVFLAGCGIAQLCSSRRPGRWLVALLCAASLAVSVRLNFFHYADPAEPYAYVPTSLGISKIVGPLRALAQRDDVYKQVSGAVLVELYHPLPWLLADFPNVNYYGAQPADETMDFAFLVVDAHRVPEVEAALNEEYVKQQALIIEGAKPVYVFFRRDLFDAIGGHIAGAR